MPTIQQHAEIIRKGTDTGYRELLEWIDTNPRKKEERHDVGSY